MVGGGQGGTLGGIYRADQARMAREDNKEEGERRGKKGRRSEKKKDKRDEKGKLKKGNHGICTGGGTRACCIDSDALGAYYSDYVTHMQLNGYIPIYKAGL